MSTTFSFFFWMKKIVTALLLPPISPIILIFLGLVLWKRRCGRVLAWTGLLVGVLSTSPVTVNCLLAGLEPERPLQMEEADKAQAIVILGGGRMIDAPEYGGDTVGIFTLERLRYGAYLARKLGLPVLVSGGAPGGQRPEAELMKATLEEDFHVPVRWADDTSLDTRQNARHSATILGAQSVHRIVLVTHANHMRRARAEFEAQGFTVLAAPTGWMGSQHRDRVLPTLLPNTGSTVAGWQALREWMGLLAQWLSPGSD